MISFGRLPGPSKIPILPLLRSRGLLPHAHGTFVVVIHAYTRVFWQPEPAHDPADQPLVPDDAPVGEKRKPAACVLVVHPPTRRILVGRVPRDRPEFLQAFRARGKGERLLVFMVLPFIP
jgi:hypothetical protein